MQKILQSFLEIEISDQEYYDGIICYIYAFHLKAIYTKTYRIN